MAKQEDIQAALDAARRAQDEAQRVRTEAEIEAERLREQTRRYTVEADAISRGRRAYRKYRARERRRIRHEFWQQEHFTLKASAVLATIAIWVASITAVVIRSESWPILIFAVLTTAMIGSNSWRRLGIAGLLTISGIWAGAAIIAASDDGPAWPGIFALFTSAVVVFGTFRRNAWVLGLGMAAPWLATGIVVAEHGHEAAWMVVVAFATAPALANTTRPLRRGFMAIGWWIFVAVTVLVAGPEWAWLSLGALVLAWFPLGGGFRFFRGFEWDLWQNDRGTRSSMAGSNDG